MLGPNGVQCKKKVQKRLIEVSKNEEEKIKDGIATGTRDSEKSYSTKILGCVKIIQVERTTGQSVWSGKWK